LQLNQDLKLVTQRIIELGDKETVTKEDLPYIISDVLDSQSYQERIVVESYILSHAKGLRPSTTLSLKLMEKSLKNTRKVTDNLMHL
jgi:D-citramalate synthase